MMKTVSPAQSRSVPVQTARFLAAAASLVAIGAVGFFTATPAANATEYVWGDTNGNWADGTSWVGGSAPDGTDGDTYRLFRDGATGSAGNVVTIADGTTIYLTSVANSTPNQGSDNYDTSLAAYRGGLVIRGNNDIWTIQGGTLDTGTFVDGAYAIHIAPATGSGNGGVNIASAITGSGSIFIKEEGSNGAGPTFSGDLSGFTGKIYGAQWRTFFFKGNATELNANATITYSPPANGNGKNAAIAIKELTSDFTWAGKIVGNSPSSGISVEAGNKIVTFAPTAVLTGGALSLNSGTTVIRLGANISQKINLNDATIQFVDNYNKIITLNNANAKVKVGTADPNDDTAEAITVTYGNEFENTNKGITKIGKGTLVLTGNNNYYGGNNYTIAEGTLSISQDNNISTGVNTINGGTLRVTGNTTKGWVVGTNGGTLTNIGVVEFSGALSGSGALTKTGADALALTNPNPAFTGAVTIADNATLRLHNGGNFGVSANAVNLDGSNAKLELTGGSDLTFTRAVTGTGKIEQNGTASTTFTGAVNIPEATANSGTLTFQSGHINTFTVKNGAVGGLGGAEIDTLVLGSSGSDSVTLSFSTLSNVVTTLTQNAATVAIDLVGVAASLPGAGGGTITLFSDVANFNSVDVGSWTLAVPVAGNPTFQKNSNSITLVFSAFVARDLVWTGASNNAWEVGGATNWSESGAVAFAAPDNVSFTDAGANKAIKLIGAVSPGTITVTNSEGNDYVFGADGSTGKIATGTLVKNGTGDLKLTTENSYFGGTTINAGTVTATNVKAFGTGPLATSGAGRAVFDATGELLTPVALTDGATFNIGVAAGKTITLGAFNADAATTLDKTGDGTLKFNDISSTYTKLNLTLNGGVLEVAKDAALDGSVNLNAGTLKFTGGTGDIIANTATVTFGGGTLDLNGHSETLGRISGNGFITNPTNTAINLLVGSGSLADDYDIFDGIISKTNGQIVFAKVGAGTLKLTGKSTFDGRIYLSGGVTEIDDFGDTTGGPLGKNIPVTNRDTIDYRLSFFNNAVLRFTGTYGVLARSISSNGADSVLSGTGTGSKATAPILEVRDVDAVLAIPYVHDLGTFNKTGAGTLFFSDAGASVVTDDSGLNPDGSVKDGYFAGGHIKNGTMNANEGWGTILNIQAGTIVLARRSNFDGNGGGVVIGANGTLRLASISEVGASNEQIADNAKVTLSGGTFNLTGRDEKIGNIETSGGLITNGTVDSNGKAVITQGKLTLGTVTKNGNVAPLILEGVKIVGNVTLNNNTGTLVLRTGAEITGTLNLNSGNTIEFSPTAQSDVFTYDKAIGGNANVAKSGAGKAILTQANAYTGTTTVTAGVLEIQGAQAGNGAFDVTGGTLLVKGSIGTGAVTVSGTGILGGTGTINGAITIEEGGTLSPGASVETLSITGDVTFKAGSTLLIEMQYVGDQWTYDVLNVSSGVTLTFEEGAQLQIVNLGTEPLTKGVEINFFGSELPNFVGNPFGSVSFEGFGDDDFGFTIGPDGKFAVVPEPGTYALFGGIGAVALALLRRRRKSRTGL